MKRIVYTIAILSLLFTFAFVLPVAADEACPGAPAPRLTGETQGRVAQSFSSLRAAVGSNVILDVMRSNEVFEITGDPVCFGPHYWYPVTFEGRDGWATEGWLNQYWLEPVSDSAGDDDDFGTGGPLPQFDPVTGVRIREAPEGGCPGAPEPRLTDGAQVSDVFSSLRAGVHSNNVLRVLRTGDTMEVLAGPVCSNLGPFNWYRVRTTEGGLVGWVTEGTGSNNYWLEPVELEG